MEIIGKNGEKIPQIHSEDYERKPEFKADREVRVLKNGAWEVDCFVWEEKFGEGEVE